MQWFNDLRNLMLSRGVGKCPFHAKMNVTSVPDLG